MQITKQLQKIITLFYITLPFEESFVFSADSTRKIFQIFTFKGRQVCKRNIEISFIEG